MIIQNREIFCYVTGIGSDIIISVIRYQGNDIRALTVEGSNSHVKFIAEILNCSIKASRKNCRLNYQNLAFGRRFGFLFADQRVALCL